MRKPILFLILICVIALLTACGASLDKHSAGLILAEHMNGKLLLDVDLWSDLQDSVGDFVICDPIEKVIFVRANFSKGKVRGILKTQVIEDASCTASPKQN